MSVSIQESINERICVMSDDEQKLVLSFVNGLRKDAVDILPKPISAIFEELSSEIPLNNWSELPVDGAENHDHYLYGAPKKHK